jgi:hypothetical protein
VAGTLRFTWFGDTKNRPESDPLTNVELPSRDVGSGTVDAETGTEARFVPKTAPIESGCYRPGKPSGIDCRRSNGVKVPLGCHYKYEWQ